MHRLSAEDLTALARGLGDRRVMAYLRRAEMSKHLLLIRAVLTGAAREYPEEYRAAGVAAARDVLVAVQLKAPAVAAEIITLPQVGAWAMECLGRLRAARRGGRKLTTDLGYFNSLAAAAAARAGQAFRLAIPLYDDVLRIPTVASAHFGPSKTGDWVEAVGIRSDSGVTIVADRSPEKFLVPSGVIRGLAPGPRSPSAGDSPWTAPPRLRSTTAGLALDVALDDGDPYLDRYERPRMNEMLPADLRCFKRRIQGAWRILVRHHPEYAQPIAETLRMIVPLVAATGQRTSATNTTAFGAVAMSVPEEDVGLAETLVHEFQHLKLCALLDLVPLLNGEHDRPCYAPWRSEPRPAGGLLQGAYAYLGVVRFWRGHRLVARGDEAFRAQVEFARWRAQTPAAVETLLTSGRLTATGRRFTMLMRNQLSKWRADQVSQLAERIAGEMCIHHRVQWQLRYVAPDPQTIDRLARQWAGDTSPAAPFVRAETVAEAVPAGVAPPEPRSLAGMLALRYLDTARYARWCKSGQLDAVSTGAVALCAGDVALLRHQDRVAVSSYRQQIAAGRHSTETWVGLALALHRTAHRTPATTAFLRHITLLSALHGRLTAMTGSSIDPVDLADWLAADSGRSP